MKYPVHLLSLIDILKKLPGVGNRSAERFAFQLLEWPPEQLHKLGDIVKNIHDNLKNCTACGCLIGTDACSFCNEALRDPNVICVIASPKDAFSIDQTGEFKGLYHVLGGVLSPMEGFGPEKLPLGKLKERIQALERQARGEGCDFLVREIAPRPAARLPRPLSHSLAVPELSSAGLRAGLS